MLRHRAAFSHERPIPRYSIIATPPSKDREQQRIAKLLARAGIASRREIERMIADRRIAVNGVALDTPATLLPSLHGVTVDGVPVEAPAPARLFRFHKPAGLLTTERDPRGRPTIYDRLPDDLPRVVPVGRLDLNTEGLLLLTTDGELKRQLELPATGVPRTYRARAFGEISQDRLEDLIEGIEIDGVRYGSIDANLERRTGANVWIELTLTEGKNREVRRVLEHLGLRVSRLIRTRYGPIPLGDMAVGAVDEIRRHDLILFRKSLDQPHARRADWMVTETIAVRGPRSAAAEPTTVAPPASRRKPVTAAARSDKPVAQTAAVRPPRKRRPDERLTTRRDDTGPTDRTAPRPDGDARPDRPHPQRTRRPSNRKRRPGDARPSRPRS